MTISFLLYLVLFLFPFCLTISIRTSFYLSFWPFPEQDVYSSSFGYVPNRSCFRSFLIHPAGSSPWARNIRGRIGIPGKGILVRRLAPRYRCCRCGCMDRVGIPQEIPENQAMILMKIRFPSFLSILTSIVYRDMMDSSYYPLLYYHSLSLE